MRDQTEAPKCIHMTADMAKECPICNPPPFSWPEGGAVCAPREVYDAIQERVFPTDQTEAPERIDPRDLRIDAWGYNGPDTHVSGVTITHLPSGVRVAVDGLGQHRNRYCAMKAMEQCLGSIVYTEDVAQAMVAAALEEAASLPKQVYDNVVDREAIRALITPEQSAALDRVKAEARREALEGEWDDRPDDLTPAIKEDWKNRTENGFFKRYDRAHQLVGNRRSKGALLSLVALLLKDGSAAIRVEAEREKG